MRSEDTERLDNFMIRLIKKTIAVVCKSMKEWMRSNGRHGIKT
jgi:hypothetical protein